LGAKRVSEPAFVNTGVSELTPSRETKVVSPRVVAKAARLVAIFGGRGEETF
jgi:hypothetical protein